MAVARPGPSGVERSLLDDELIVTKTDPKGRITYANDVFLRISALAEHEAVGKPHNVVRHPDMPRGVYKYLWANLEERREVFAYVKNLAADGAHYWVLAHVTPTVGADGHVIGYHSNRRRPSAGGVAAAQALYSRVLAAERAHTSARDAARAGLEALVDLLDREGLTYPRLVWSHEGNET